MAITYVGTGGTYTATSGTTSFTISTGACNAGDLVLLRVNPINAPATVTVSVTDTGGNTWTTLASRTSDLTNTLLFVLGATMQSAGTFTVTVTLSAAATRNLAVTDVFRGASLTVDGSATNGTTNFITSWSVGPFSSNPGDLLYIAGAGTSNSSPPSFTTTTAGFTTLTRVTSTSGALLASYLANAAGGSVSWSATSSSSGGWSAVGVSLRDPSANQPPTANAGPDQSVAAGATVTLTGIDSDPDSNIVSRDWTQTGGPTVTLSGSGATRTFTAPSLSTPSTLTFSYTVTDAGGLTASDDVTVNVAALPAPVAAFTATPTSGTAPLAVSFTDTSTGGPTGWAWDFGDGATSAAQHPTHTYTSVGTYTATLTASNAGGSSTATTTITVTPATVGRLRLGDSPVGALYLGDTPVSKVYLGDTLIWP